LGRRRARGSGRHDPAGAGGDGRRGAQAVARAGSGTHPERRRAGRGDLPPRRRRGDGRRPRLRAQSLQDRAGPARHHPRADHCRSGREDRMTQERNPAALIGPPVDRVDGRLKVTGGARYSAEFKVEGVTHGVLVTSTIASGRIREIDTQAAEQVPGVLAVITHLNAPRLPFVDKRSWLDPKIGRTLPVLQEDTIYFSGQPVAVVVAETLEQAEYAATRVRVAYDERPSVTS